MMKIDKKKNSLQYFPDYDVSVFNANNSFQEDLENKSSYDKFIEALDNLSSATTTLLNELEDQGNISAVEELKLSVLTELSNIYDNLEFFESDYLRGND